MRWEINLLVLSACGTQSGLDTALQRMRDQPRYDSYEESHVFPNGAVMQPPPDGTVPRNGALDHAPPPVSPAELLARGRSRYEIFCAVCHGAGGYGGSVVAWNMVERRPPSLRRPELSAAPQAYFYQVITRGLGRMPSYAAQLPVADRWAVVAYLNDLQHRTKMTPEEWLDSISAAQLRAQDSAAQLLAQDSSGSGSPP